MSTDPTAGPAAPPALPTPPAWVRPLNRAVATVGFALLVAIVVLVVVVAVSGGGGAGDPHGYGRIFGVVGLVVLALPTVLLGRAVRRLWTQPSGGMPTVLCCGLLGLLASAGTTTGAARLLAIVPAAMVAASAAGLVASIGTRRV